MSCEYQVSSIADCVLTASRTRLTHLHLSGNQLSEVHNIDRLPALVELNLGIFARRMEPQFADINRLQHLQELSGQA